MRWSVERRLEFIEFRLYWDGRLNRGDLVQFFGISVPQASADLSRYERLAPGNLSYNKTAKTYVASPEFRPLFFKPSADHYLAQLRFLAAGILTGGETWLDRPPSFALVPLIRRRLDANALRRVLDAVRTRAALHVKYQSFSGPVPAWRWISPHALGFDGFRWHVRAWCHKRNAFRDFVLARILKLGEVKPSDVDQEVDAEWQREVTLRLAPHPAMEEGIRRAIELDHGMVDGAVEVRTRVCLFYYLERQLGLDLDPEVVPPERQHLVLVNRDEVEAARRDARAASTALSRAQVPGR